MQQKLLQDVPQLADDWHYPPCMPHNKVQEVRCQCCTAHGLFEPLCLNAAGPALHAQPVPRSSASSITACPAHRSASDPPARRYVTVEGSELRLGVYESSSTLCVYLESDAVGATLEHNLWVKFRVALLPAKHAGEPVWKQSAICTKTWNNSVLQFAKVGPGLPAVCWVPVR